MAFVLVPRRVRQAARRGDGRTRRRACRPCRPSCPRNRLGLAQWLLRPGASAHGPRDGQSLLAGGVRHGAREDRRATSASTGELPSHPELLDWLAVEFRESGWDVKQFFKLMVTSATYRQAAVVTPEKLEKDPQNRLLSRGPRFRMDAEMVRDYALAASGLLVAEDRRPERASRISPTGVWEAVAMIGSNTRDYKQDTGENLYRRSMYTFWKRAAPPASMDIFNAPSREICTVRRERTNTPLQALVTLNDPQFVEAARHLAERAIAKGGGEARRTGCVSSRERLLARPFGRRKSRSCAASLREADCATTRAIPTTPKQLIDGGRIASPTPIDPADTGRAGRCWPTS